jgi:maltose alpha-D-glucosyltransferase / alpha-amylase
MPFDERYLDADPMWYKDAIIYETHVKSFYDSDGDGIGDFRGLLYKLDYLKDLGITALWLLPFYPSPLRDDGYDIADYYDVHPNYGSLRDFREFLKAAHYRGIRVITELVVNHTSDQHRWFQRARRAKPGSNLRDFYVWSDTPHRYTDARIIFKDFETSNWTWDPLAKAYYWHRFYSHQPDLNFDNPQVQKELTKVLDFWLSMGVDGLRLDAVPYLYEREGTNCENLPETHEFLKKLRRYVQDRYTGKMLLAEANQWPEDAVAYFGDGDECNMCFHFPIMPRIFMALWMEDRFPILDILDQTPAIPDSCQWAMFLRNHDELTLEMVSDEERDYMYQVYAKDRHARINLGIRRRLAPLMGNNRRKIELINFLLFSLPGTPIVYYGDEMGMGDNYYLGDRDGVRTPMQWSPDRNAGFSRANPQKLYLPIIIDPEYHFHALNVENQHGNLSSLLWWTRRMIGMRKRFKAFGRGSIEFPFTDNPKVLAFLREYEEEIILVVANLSRFSQVVHVDLASYAGYVPEEVFSSNRFPIIKESPYLLTLGFNDYFWFILRKGDDSLELIKPSADYLVKTNWQDFIEGEFSKPFLATVLPNYLRGCRWFGGKFRTIRMIKIIENIPISMTRKAPIALLLMIEVYFTEGSSEKYLLPVCYATGRESLMIQRDFSHAVITPLLVNGEPGIIFDAVYHEGFRRNLLATISGRKKIRGKQGEVTAYPGRRFRNLLGDKKLPLASQVVKAEQSNTSIIYESSYFIKLYRQLGEGVNPDLAITRYLTDKLNFAHVPPFAGTIEYRCHGCEPINLALVQGFVRNAGDAWTYSAENIRHYFEKILSNLQTFEVPAMTGSVFEKSPQAPPELLKELIGEFYLEMVGLLGRRTGELHLALASETGDPEFAPEPFSKLYQRSVFQSMRSTTRRTMQVLKKSFEKLPEAIKDEAKHILDSEREILNRLRRITEKKINVVKIRIHGDFHLAQVLYTGNDFILIDFEGEPTRPLTERSIKRSPLRDVTGMIRSFQYVAYNSLMSQSSGRIDDFGALEPWIQPWLLCVSRVFWSSYLESVGQAAFIPEQWEDLQVLLQSYLLEKAVYELGYELNNRLDWVMIPIKGIKQIMESM